MARFYPIYVRRSDGKVEIVGRGKRRELNQPTDDQMDQKPDKNGVSDFYREILPEETKHLDWRRKLGGMLARELDHKDKTIGGDAGYMLVTFPESYRLYEHVKKTERDGKTDIKTKTHAAGGNDRQDAYLYGHPAGRKKRFRSPADFFPHLMWLAMDQSGDPDNCRCKICSPEDLEAVIPNAAKAKPAEKSLPTKAADVTTTLINTGSPATAIAGGPRLMQRVPSSSGPPSQPSPLPTLQQQPQHQPQSQAQAQANAQPQPTPLKEPKIYDQSIDCKYNSFMFRTGELVWFQRSQAWGLGVILSRWTANKAGQSNYSIQPLSHPFAHLPPTTKTSDLELRPWLAWSVPAYTNAHLNDLRDPPTYTTADWQGILQKRYGNGDLEVDASILAAKAIDASYTPLHLSRTDNLDSGVSESHYHGLFVGAEKVWVGEPVRLQVGTGTDILVIHDIILQAQPDVSSSQRLLKRSLILVGDIYSLVHVAHPDPTLPSPAAPNNNPQLPRRLTEDLAWRNARSIHSKHQAAFWKLKAAGQRTSLTDIKGRWYEASLLLPILQSNAFQETAARGEIQEAGLYMNSRHDCQNQNRNPALPRIPRVDILKETRREALGQAVPPTAQIEDNGMPPSTIDPSLATANSTAGNMGADPNYDSIDNTTGGLDDFMNLEGGEERSSIAGYNPRFGGQDQMSGFY